MKELEIKNELRDLIYPLNTDEYKQLEENIISDGCLSPIIVWNNIIVDGHNRYKICNENNIDYKIEAMQFNNIEDVEEWIIKNQFGRRNLSPYQRVTLALKLESVYSEKAKQKELIRKTTLATLPKSDMDLWDMCEKIDTRKEIAKAGGVGERNISKVKVINEKVGEEIKGKLERGELTINSVYKEITKNEKMEASKNAILKEVDIDAEDKVVNMDAISFLKSLPDNSVSMVCTDPPYGIGFKPPRNVGNETFMDEKEETLELIEAVCQELVRVCKENTHLYFFSGSNIFEFQQIISKYFSVERHPLIWVKNNHTMCDFSKHYANKYEFIIMAKKGEGRLLNNNCSPDVLEYAKPSANERWHDTQKPTELLEYLIENSSMEGEVVLDMFGGSLSTYRAAKNVNRKCYTCEIDETIYKKSINRI